MKGRLRTPTPAFVVSLVALFVALVGTTYAATSLPKGSVGTAQLKNGAVTKTKINKKTITALKGSRGPQGPQGAPGPKGDTGLQGSKGDIGPTGPSDAFASSAPGVRGLAVKPSLTTVVSKTVPAGNYVINAKTVLFNSVLAERIVSCEIDTPAGTLDTSVVDLSSAGSAGGSQESIPLQGTISLGSTTAVSVNCAADSGSLGQVTTAEAELTLIGVGAIQ